MARILYSKPHQLPWANERYLPYQPPQPYDREWIPNGASAAFKSLLTTSRSLFVTARCRAERPAASSWSTLTLDLFSRRNWSNESLYCPTRSTKGRATSRQRTFGTERNFCHPCPSNNLCRSSHILDLFVCFLEDSEFLSFRTLAWRPLSMSQEPGAEIKDVSKDDVPTRSSHSIRTKILVCTNHVLINPLDLTTIPGSSSVPSENHIPQHEIPWEMSISLLPLEDGQDLVFPASQRLSV